MGGPEGDGDGEDGEVGAVSVASEGLKEPPRKRSMTGEGEGDHPAAARREEARSAGDGAVDGGGEVGEAALAEERGEEGE